MYVWIFISKIHFLDSAHRHQDQTPEYLPLIDQNTSGTAAFADIACQKRPLRIAHDNAFTILVITMRSIMLMGALIAHGCEVNIRQVVCLANQTKAQSYVVVFVRLAPSEIHSTNALDQKVMNVQSFILECFGRGRPKLFVDHDDVIDFEVLNIHNLLNRLWVFET